MLRSDKLLIVFITSLVCACLFTLSFINIAYCDDTYVSTWNANFSQWETNDLNADLRLTTSTNDILAVLSPSTPSGGRGGYVVSDKPFTSSFHPYIDNEQQFTGFDDIESNTRTFSYHGISYTYYYCELFSYYYSVPDNLRPIAGESAVLDFESDVDLESSWTYSDYIYLLYKGIIDNPNLETPEGYYIPDNVQIVEASDTLSSKYDANKNISCTIAIPNTTHASYLNVKNVKVGYNNILAYLKYNFSFSSIFAKKFTFYDVEINPSFSNQEDNIKLLQENVKYEKYYCDLPSFVIDDLQNPLYMAIENYDINVPDNVDSIQMPYDNKGYKNIAFEQYKRNNTNLSDYIYPNLPCSKTISYDCTLSDANLNKESDVFTITAMFDDDGKLSSVYYSGGTNPNGTEVKPQSYSASQNYNNLISKNDSEQGNQDNDDLSEDAEKEGKTLVTNTDDWNDINIDNVGFKGTLTSLFDMIKETLPFLQTIMFFVPSWVFALMALVLATVVIMRILGR